MIIYKQVEVTIIKVLKTNRILIHLVWITSWTITDKISIISILMIATLKLRDFKQLPQIQLTLSEVKGYY